MIGLFVLAAAFACIYAFSGPTLAALLLLSFLGLLTSNANRSSWDLQPPPKSHEGILEGETAWMCLVFSEWEACCPASFYLLQCIFQSQERYGEELGAVLAIISVMGFLAVIVLWDLALLPIALSRALLRSVDHPVCMIICAPAYYTWPWVPRGMTAGFVLCLMLGSSGSAVELLHFLFPAAVAGAWPGALLGAFVEFCGDAGESFVVYLLPKQPLLLSPYQLLYSQDSIAAVFQDGQPVTQDRGGLYCICACFHNDRLFTLNNRTLYSAACNGRLLKVTVVEKPSTWSQRFTGHFPWTSVRVRGTMASGLMAAAERQALILPAAAFPQDVPRAQGHVTLEVDRLIKATRPQVETLAQLMRNRCSNLYIESVDGDRSYARVRIKIADEDIVRAVIKAIGRERGKRGINIKVVPESRIFESPRD